MATAVQEAAQLCRKLIAHADTKLDPGGASPNLNPDRNPKLAPPGAGGSDGKDGLQEGQEGGAGADHHKLWSGGGVLMRDTPTREKKKYRWGDDLQPEAPLQA